MIDTNIPTQGNLEKKKYSHTAPAIQDYWGFTLEGKELEKILQQKEEVQNIGRECMATFIAVLEDFTGMDSDEARKSPPSFHMTDTVYGSSGVYHASSNSIALPLKLIVPLYRGEVESLADTAFFDTFGHELGHYMLIAQVTHGNLEEFAHAELHTSPVIQEFFARLCQRAIADSLSISIVDAKLEDFAQSDAHRVFVYADEIYASIQAMTKEERKAFFTNIDKMEEAIAPYLKVYREAQRRIREQRRRR